MYTVPMGMHGCVNTRVRKPSSRKSCALQPWVQHTGCPKNPKTIEIINMLLEFKCPSKDAYNVDRVHIY
jgi:hypothetical protein